MQIRVFLCGAFLAGLCCQTSAVTNTTLMVNTTSTNASLTVREGEIAEVLYANLGSIFGFGSAELIVTIGNTSFRVENSYATTLQIYGPSTSLKLPIVAGPAVITLQTIDAFGAGYCTIRVTQPEGSFVPNNAVVIPSDSSGPVKIILESSVDLVNWTAAQPGVYGASTTKRFFRVRAEQQTNP
jgi:hypothetical protein